MNSKNHNLPIPLESIEEGMEINYGIGEISNDKLKIELHRIIYSDYCMYYYLSNILASMMIFFYSVIAYFSKWDELPIIIGESLLTILVIFDIALRGYRIFFSKLKNYLDFLLVLGSLVTITLYIKVHNQLEELEDISFALILLLRNFSQLLRLVVLIKNRNQTKANIEEAKVLSTFKKDFVSLAPQANKEAALFMEDNSSNNLKIQNYLEAEDFFKSKDNN